MLLTASSNAQLDQLLENICVTLQLTDTQYRKAQEHYEAVGTWLSKPESPLASFKPSIYPQGSARLQTMVKPLGQEEHDVDLVCLLSVCPQLYRLPMIVYQMVEQRLKENGLYKEKVERFKRCLRITYANEFHLDITPACPDPFHGGTHICVPDRKLQQWKPSNPIGYAAWFEKQALRAGQVFAAKRIEPLPVHEPAHDKAPLRRAVQLLKRHRDIVFKGDDRAPRSIALTTLAGQYYGGEALVTDALIGVLDRIVACIETTPGIIAIANPANPSESFSEAWTNNPEHYRMFVEFIYGFRYRFQSLLSQTGLDNIARGLTMLFGEQITMKAVAAFTERMSQAREQDRLHFGKLLVGLSTLASGTRPVPKNTFYGQ